MVNFVGARHLAEQLVPKMSQGSAISVISSSAAIGWQNHIKTITGLLETDGFDAAVEWLSANESKWSWSGYAYSKYVIDAWVGWWYPELGRKGIRINCINPGPTETAMMPVFQDSFGKKTLDDAIGPVGRYARRGTGLAVGVPRQPQTQLRRRYRAVDRRRMERRGHDGPPQCRMDGHRRRSDGQKS